MNWYLARVVYRIICGEGNHTPQFDEQLRLLFAPCEADALEKAKRIGTQEQDTFFNDRQQLVKWQFVNVTELYHLHQSLDGAEVYSQLNEVSSAEAYTSFIHDKAAAFRHRIAHTNI